MASGLAAFVITSLGLVAAQAAIVTSQSEKGLLPPKCILNKTISIMNKQIMLTDTKGILEHPTYKSFVDRIQGIETIEVKKKGRDHH